MTDGTEQNVVEQPAMQAFNPKIVDNAYFDALETKLEAEMQQHEAGLQQHALQVEQMRASNMSARRMVQLARIGLSASQVSSSAAEEPAGAQS